MIEIRISKESSSGTCGWEFKTAAPCLAGKQPYLQLTHIPCVGALIAYVDGFVPELHKRKIPCDNGIQETDPLLCQCCGRSDLPSVACGVGDAICLTACSQVLAEPHISKINAVNPETGKKMRQEIRRSRDTYFYVFLAWNMKAYSDLSCLK